MKTTAFLILALFVFSFGVAQTGPAGVGNSSSNGLWLKADDLSLNNNDPVVTWTDASGNNNHASAATSQQPLFILSSSLNNMPALNFDGNNDIMTIPDADILDGSSGLTYFVVIRPRNLNTQPLPILSKRLNFNSSDNAYTLFFHSSNYLNLDINTNNDRFNTGPTSFSNSTNYIISFNFDGSLAAASRVKVSTMGTVIKTATETSTSVTNCTEPLMLSAFNVGDNRQLGADYAEVIHYNFSLNDAQTIIVNNYLSAKYDIALTSNDLFTQDEVANGHYDFDVAGIGRVDASNIHDDAKGSGIVRISNPTGLDDGEFLFWGHDNGNQDAIDTTDIPVGMQARLERVWRVSEVNTSSSPIDVGAINISFDLSRKLPVTAADLRLLVDTDNDGLFNDETPISGATNIGGNVFQFAGVTAIENNFRFTLGTIDTSQTPLPVELLDFKATVTNKNQVQLEWQTASEINNDFFTVQRSSNSHDWKEIEMIYGAGNSSSQIRYSTIDKNPLAGESFYRLKQTDFDGSQKYSEIIKVEIETSSHIKIYPNPATNKITIDGGNIELEDISIYSTLGKNVSEKTTLFKAEQNKVEIDLSKLISGNYLIKTKTETFTFFKH